MWLHSVKLHNIRQHRHLDISFSGFTGIIGANASGKTNFILSLRDCLSLNSAFSTKKENLVTWGEKSGFIEVEFSAGVSDERFLATLTVGGKEAGRTVKDMEGRVIAATPDATVEFLTALFGGADQAVVDALSFAKQSELLQVLFQRGSVRGKLAQRIVGASDASRINALAIEALGLVPLIDVQSTRNSLAWFEAQGAEIMAKRILYSKTIEEAKGLPSLENLSSRIALKTGASGSSAQILELERQIAQAELDAAAAGNRVEGLKSRLAGKTSRQIWGMIDLAEARELAISKSMEMNLQAEEIRNSIREADTGEDLAIEHKRLEDEISRIRREIPAASLIPTMREHGQCPACLRGGLTPDDVEALAQHCKDADKEIADLRAEMTKIEGVMIKRKQDLVALKESLRKVTTSDVAYAYHTEAAKGQPKNSSEKLRSVLLICSQLEDELADEVGQEKAIRANLANLRSRLSSIPEPGPEDPATVEELIAWRDATLVAAQAVEALQDLQWEEESRQVEIQRLEGILETELGNIGTRSLICALRDLMSYDQAPLAYASAKLGEVAEGMGAIITTLGYDYRVSAGSEFDFSYSKDGGRTWVSADFLSGGEKTALVLAFRVEVARIHASGIRMMALDEPTVWMQESVRAQFPQVLASMKRLSDMGGIQFLVSTHDREVLSCFDTVIEL